MTIFFKTNEIQDVVLKWNLPTKFNACKAAMSQKLPHHFSAAVGIRRNDLANARLRLVTGRW
jgi:hypothetical protein